MNDDPYDTPNGTHEFIKIGKWHIFRHDYDGPYLAIFSSKDGKNRDLLQVHASELEELLNKYFKGN